MHFTDSDLKDLRDTIKSLENDADDIDERASKRVAEYRDEGINPLVDSDAHAALMEMERDASEKRDEAAALRERYEDAIKTRRARGDRNPPRGFLNDPNESNDDAPRPAGLGARFVQTDAYRSMREQLEAGRDLQDVIRNTPTVDVSSRAEARSLLMRDVDAAVLEQPDRKGMIGESHAYRPVRVLNVITVGETDADSLEYVAEDAPSENAADTPYADGQDVDDGPDGANQGTLPESSYGFSEQTVNVHRVGHYVPATERQLSDTAGLRTMLDTRLRGGVRRRFETLVVAGDSGSGDAWDGLYNAGNLNTLSKDAADTRYDTAMKAKTLIRIASEGMDEPSVIGLHPNDWQAIVLEKDADGNYLNRRGANEPSMVFGLRPVVSTVFTEGSPIIGDYSGAYLWMRTGISVTSTDSHKDWFLKGWIAMKAQARAAFATVIGRKFTLVSNFNN